MKKILLSFLCFTIWGVQSQVEIRLPNETDNVAGTTLTYNVTLNDVPSDDEYAYWEGAKFYVYNMSNADVQYRLKRVKVSAPSDWKDNLCWPPTCYTYSYLQQNNSITPVTGAPTVISGSSNTDQGGPAEIKPQFYPGTPGSTATYKYYVTNMAGTEYYDSITVVVNYLNNLSLSTVQKSVELSMSPNPANDYVSILAEGLSDAKIRVVDVLGNVVYTGDFNNSKKLNISEYKNGVYFVTIQNSSVKGLTKKLVVRH